MKEYLAYSGTGLQKLKDLARKKRRQKTEETLTKILLVTADIFIHIDTRHPCFGTVLAVKALCLNLCLDMSPHFCKHLAPECFHCTPLLIAWQDNLRVQEWLAHIPMWQTAL